MKAAQGGQADALKAVGHNGTPETNPVCQTIRARLGAGRKGRELRDEFESSPMAGRRTRWMARCWCCPMPA